MGMDQEISGIGKRLASDRKISAILEAAEFEFACNGYEGTTIQSIADRAKMTKRQVLYFFTNKKKIHPTPSTPSTFLAKGNNSPRLLG